MAPNVLETDAIATINKIFPNQVKVKNRAQYHNRVKINKNSGIKLANSAKKKTVRIFLILL